ncbi:MAG: SBBP repeat-containing protein [Bacteroidia bacterium]|nr:SBBP repeat-containing protein [Bacteroidia bacterium]
MHVYVVFAQGSQDAQNKLAKIDRLFFIENKGQWHDDVLYLCRMGGLDAWITKYGVNYTFYKIERDKTAEFSRADMPKSKFDHDPENEILLGHRVLFELENHNPNPVREGKMQLEGYYNYFIGNDETKHATYVGLYKEAVVKNVYEGIDIRYYFDKGNLRYDFVVQPYADISQIKFKLRGQYSAYTKGESQLCFATRFGEIAMADLYTYQGSHTIQSKFIKNNDFWQISLDIYDRSKALVIDPLIYSTYIGGSNSDLGECIAVDGSGSAYVTGRTTSTNYDITAGAFQTTNAGSWDVFVTKLNASGSGLVYSTYIGGSYQDRGYSIAVDGSGCAYVTGYTQSFDYDVTAGAFKTTKAGGGTYDVFVTKLNALGSVLVYSTYIGGVSDDIGYSIAVDGSECAYVTGETWSTGYHVTTGAFQTTHGGGTHDVFVTKLNASGSGLVYSTYIGGSSSDYGRGIAVDGSGSAYVTGFTGSTNYDVTAGAFQTTNGGGWDVFVTKLNASGSSLVYSTYIGGSSGDYGYGIAVDGSGYAYITGGTYSTTDYDIIPYDITPCTYQSTHGGGDEDLFVTVVSPGGTYLAYSTYLGGTGHEEPGGITLDNSGYVYVCGYTGEGYPTTPGAFQTIYDGGW